LEHNWEGITLTQSIASYLLSAEKQLRIKISLIQDADIDALNMGSPKGAFAFTENPATFSPNRYTVAKHMLIEELFDRDIIVWKTVGDAGFGIYDEDQSSCLLLDLHALVHTWDDEPAWSQRLHIGGILLLLDEILK
jgi:hypothetical protein